MAAQSTLAKLITATPPVANDEILMELLCRWKKAVVMFRANFSGGSDETSDALAELANEIAEDIAAIPASGVDGLAIKLFLTIEGPIGLTDGPGFEINWADESEWAARRARPALADALRLAPAVAAVLES